MSIFEVLGWLSISAQSEGEFDVVVNWDLG